MKKLAGLEKVIWGAAFAADWVRRNAKRVTSTSLNYDAEAAAQAADECVMEFRALKGPTASARHARRTR